MTNELAQFPQRASLLTKLANRYSVEPTKMMETLKATAFKTEKPISNEQLMALLIVADQHNLNPFTREIFAYPDKNGGIVPVVSIDGWARILNEQPDFDGIEFVFADDSSACTCTVHRKSRSHPTVVVEYLAECKRSTPPWGSHPRRMLRHRAMIQAARIAFGFSFADPDEASRIAEGSTPAAVGIDAVRAAMARQQAPADTIDMATGEITTREPSGPSYAQVADAIQKAESAEAAQQALDAAEGLLPEDQVADLRKVRDRKWSAKPSTTEGEQA